MVENTRLPRPAAEQNAVVPVGPGARLELAFDQGEADISREGQDLVLRFDDGGLLRLQSFYDNFAEGAQPPVMVVQGEELPGVSFLEALHNPDMAPAAGPLASAAPTGAGAYEDAVLHGVDGVTRLDKLTFDGWGRALDITETYRGAPAAAVHAGASEEPGGSYGMTGSGMYEDWRPNQHEGDYGTKLYGKLDFSFTPTGSTVVDAIHLSNFDAGTVIVIGAPQFDADGNIVNGRVVTDASQSFTFTQNDFGRDGVYVLPPKHSDHDMDISTRVDMHAESSGRFGSMSGQFTIVVDAVADMPLLQDAGFADTGHAGQVGQVGETGEVRKEFDDAGRQNIEQQMSGVEQTSVTAPFHAVVRFDDYDDGSEAHYVLIELPSTPAGAIWTCADASGNPLGMISGPDGREYFQLPVDNRDIADNGGTISVDARLTVSGDSATVKDADFSLKVGAMAVERPDDGEFLKDNNVSFDFMDNAAHLHLDVVDGGLKITAGWASEGDNDAKHLDLASSGYVYGGREAGATGNLADGATNTGAPLTIEAGVDSHGRPEMITSVSLSYDAGEGHIFQYNGTEWVDLDPGGSGMVALDGLGAARLDTLVYRPNPGSISDADVDVRYKVDVQNEAGVKGGYSGAFTIVADAAADMSGPVHSVVTETHDGRYYADHAAEIVKDADEHGAKGWESDSFKLDYSHLEYGFTVHAAADFPDADGSERHYILVERQDGWNIGDLPDGYSYAGEHAGSDGKNYFKIELDDRSSSAAELDVPLFRTGASSDLSVSLKTGSYVEEANTSGREYDLGNNVAERNDGVVANLKADVLNSTLTVKTGWASEENNDAKHLGGTSDRYTYDGAESSSTDTDGRNDLNIGAPVSLSLANNNVGARESIVSVKFEFDDSRGSLWVGGKEYHSGELIPVGAASMGSLRFRPATEGSQGYNDADVDMKYEVVVSNGAVSHTFSASSTIILDAVADRPSDVHVPGADGKEITYVRSADADASSAAHEAAAWNSEISFKTGASFHDVADGSEAHYVLVEALPGWSGAYDTLSHDGRNYFVIDVNEAIAAALEGGGSYERNGVRAEIVYDAEGAPHADVSVDVSLRLPDRPDAGKAPEYMREDGQLSLAAGGLAVEGGIRWEDGAKGHAAGKIHTSGTDGEYDLQNNVAIALEDVKVNVNVVESRPHVSITDNNIYENLTANAHRGDASPSAGAKITVGKLAGGEEAEITFHFDFARGGAKEGSFDSAPGHQDDVMRLELVDGDGAVTGVYPITWNGTDWSCAVRLEGGSDATLIFKPGFNYNAADIGIKYEITATDPLSGDQASWKSGDGRDLPELTVTVDAVAQQPVISDVAAGYERTGGTDAFIGGGKVDIGIKLEYQDFEDSSERHFVLLESRAGWQEPADTLSILDKNGVAHDVPVKWDMQMIDGKMYYKAEVDNRHIQEWGQKGEHGDGTLDIHIAMQSPPGVASHVDFMAGGGAWEDKSIVDGERSWDNNISFVFGKVGIDFSAAGSFALSPGAWVYENDTPDAYAGSEVSAGGTSLTVTLSHQGDVVTDFRFAGYDGIQEKGGTIFFKDPSSGELTALNADGSIPGNPPLHGGDQFVFIPNHNYSDADVNLGYSGVITDPRSGDAKTPAGQAAILVDAVAQMPEAVAFAQDGHKLDIQENPNGGGASFTLDISAKFDDAGDGSESHYILVEVLPNMSVPGSEGTFSIRDPGSGEYISYWKVPVNQADIDASGKAGVRVTVVIDGVIPGHGIHEDIRVGALAVEENFSGDELDYRNNYAVSDGGKALVDWHGRGNEGFWADVAYENDRPGAHMGSGTPAGGALVSFGQDEGDNVHVNWPDEAGYFVDASGKAYKGGEADLPGGNGPFRFVHEGHESADIKLSYTVSGESGPRSGEGVIVVDAVAGKPAGLDEQAHVDYGHAADGAPWTAAGNGDGRGNDGSATVHVAGEFVDDDGSEKHYALLEAQPGYDVPDGEMVFLEGKAYYRVEMARDGKTGEYLLDSDGKQYADVTVRLSDPAAIGKGGHDLATGLMAEESEHGQSGNLEGQTDNNVSWTTGGNAHINVSFVDSSVSVVAPDGVGERGEGDPGFPLVISGALGDGDAFHGMSLSANGKGAFSVSDPQHVGGWEIVDGKLVISDFNAIGKIQVSFTPETHNDADISFNWSADFSDLNSGDAARLGASPRVIVDAAADAPDILESHVVSDSGNEAVQAGEGADVAVKLHFEDTGGRETHYAVLEQGAHAGTDGALLCDKASVNGVERQIVTLFDQDGKPYYAVEIPGDALLEGKGDVNVVWHVTAPDAAQDVETGLKTGGISVESGTGSGGDKELTMNNNWAENFEQTPVRISVFETKTVHLSASGAENSAGDVALHLQMPAPGTNEIITETTFSCVQAGADPGAVVGVIWYAGESHELVAGADGVARTTIVFGPGGYDQNADFRFAATDGDGNSFLNSNPVQLAADSVVRDVYLGEERGFHDSQSFNAAAEARFVMEAGDTTLVSGDSLNFDLRLRNPQGDDMTAAMPLRVSFVVANDHVPQDFSVPDQMLGLENALQDEHGNSQSWSKNEHGDCILTLTLAGGQSAMNVAFDAFHTQDQAGIVDHDQTLHLRLESVSGVNGDVPAGLDTKLYAGEEAHIQSGGSVDFTLVDADYARHVALRGITHEEAVGKEIVHVANDGMPGEHHDHDHGHIMLGAEESDNTIYASQGNDILVGGGGSDIFVWNNLNMVNGEHSLDVIKDFSKGDSLHFEDLLSGYGDGAEAALGEMLGGGQWQANGQGGGIFTATDGASGASIQMSVADAMSSLTVSYHDEGRQYTQNVELHNFNPGEFNDSPQGGEMDQADVTQMLQEILKIGGNM